MRKATAVGSSLAVIVGIMAVVAAGLPWQALSQQNSDITEAREALARLAAETAWLEEQTAMADDPVHVERLAREHLRMVREGDILFRINVSPSDVVDLPAAWPLPGVAHLLGPNEPSGPHDAS